MIEIKIDQTVDQEVTVITDVEGGTYFRLRLYLELENFIDINLDEDDLDKLATVLKLACENNGIWRYLN